jgi:IMP dehydrogenase
MKKRNVGVLPVVDKNKKVIGVITDRDVCLALAKKNKNIAKISVKDFISHFKLNSIKTGDDIKKAMREMRENKISRLPVTDKKGKLRGILSLNNLISSSLKKKGKLGKLSSSKENLAKTIKSILDRNVPKLV